MDRELEIVLYGATGFTGRLAARYLTAHAPPDLRWGLAGRDAARLDALRAQLRAEGPAPPTAVVRADAGEPGTLADMARRAQVVASTAGPFARLSDAAVDACVAARTHWVDITGETPWVRRLIERHHARAGEEGTRVIPLCGFDSVPSDLGAWMLVDELRRAFDQPTRRVLAAFALQGGGLNGGTAASALAMADAGELPALDDPLLLVPPGPPGRGEALSPPARRRSAAWEEGLGCWLAPFVMAPINVQVVLRSAALWAARGAPYGPAFGYDEGLRAGGRTSAVAVATATRLGERALRSRLGRSLVRRLAPSPGEGPSERAREGASVRVSYLGEALDGRRLLGELYCQGDAGNQVTVMFLCQGALALARDQAALPDAPRGGVLTPASGLGLVLLERLRRSGVSLSLSPPAA